LQLLTLAFRAVQNNGMSADLLKRLEAVTARLEAYAGSVGGGGGARHESKGTRGDIGFDTFLIVRESNGCVCSGRWP
jgi:hypothetical protein